jgi:solute carrier family 12 sodium/potassium/chloride transporter 2
LPRPTEAGNDDSPPSSPEITRAAYEGASSELEKKKKKKRRASVSEMYHGPGGSQLPKDVIASLTRFRQKQPKGFIDVWWLYDDGG